MFVSKNALAIIDFVPIEDIIVGDYKPQLAQLFYRVLTATVACDLKGEFPGHFDLSLLVGRNSQLRNHFGGDADGNTVSPFREFQGTPPDLHYYCISNFVGYGR